MAPRMEEAPTTSHSYFILILCVLLYFFWRWNEEHICFFPHPLCFTTRSIQFEATIDTHRKYRIAASATAAAVVAAENTTTTRSTTTPTTARTAYSPKNSREKKTRKKNVAIWIGKSHESEVTDKTPRRTHTERSK